jgi:hypothetical protein
VLGATADLEFAKTDLYCGFKEGNGCSRYEIERKRVRPKGVNAPVTARRNQQLQAAAGFDQIDCFWHRMAFAGWAAVKE